MSKRKKNGANADAYPEGTPLNDDGVPTDEMPEERARSMPLDAESMRVAHQNRSTMSRKNAGEKKVPWNADFAIRFQQCKEFHPNCRIAIEQIEPRPDNTIEGRPIGYFRDHDALVAYIREVHWRGEDATYKWRAYDDLQPQWAVGRVHFTANPEWAARRAEEAARRARDPERDHQQPQPQQQQVPYGAPPPYAYGYGGYQPPPQYLGGLPPIPGMPPPGYGPQQPPQPQQPAPPPAAPPPAAAAPPQYAPSPDVLYMLLQHLTQSTQRASQLEERARDDGLKQQFAQQFAEIVKKVDELRQQPQGQQYPPGYWDWYLEKMRAALAPPAPGVGSPGGLPSPTSGPLQPPNPLQPVRDAIEMTRSVAHASQEIASIFSPREEGPDLHANPTEESFPFDVKELPHMRVVTHKSTGQLVDATTNLMFNADKISNGIKDFLKEARGLLRDRSEDAIKMMKEQARVDEIKTQEAEKKARILEDQRKKTLVDLERRAALEERINAASAPRTAAPSPTRTQAAPARTQPLPRPTTRIETGPPVFEPPDPSQFQPPPPAPPRPPPVEQPPTATASSRFEELLQSVMRPPQDAGVPPAISEAAPEQSLPVPSGGALPPSTDREGSES